MTADTKEARAADLLVKIMPLGMADALVKIIEFEESIESRERAEWIKICEEQGDEIVNLGLKLAEANAKIEKLRKCLIATDFAVCADGYTLEGYTLRNIRAVLSETEPKEEL